MKHKGIIFDMDGTLWDSAENVAKSWNKAIAAIPVAAVINWNSMMTNN